MMFRQSMKSIWIAFQSYLPPVLDVVAIDWSGPLHMEFRLLVEVAALLLNRLFPCILSYLDSVMSSFILSITASSHW
jgi:hypothetical protein